MKTLTAAPKAEARRAGKLSPGGRNASHVVLGSMEGMQTACRMPHMRVRQMIPSIPNEL
jgi:hypothetical protein